MQNRIEISAHSFLSFEPVNFKIPDFEIVFFTSPRSVQFAQHCLQSSHKIACVGTKTAEKIKELGKNVDYIATQTIDLNQSASDFSKWANNQKVFFPVSDISKLSFSQHLNENQYQSAVVYQTIIKSKAIDPCDFYVFTSPSNVRGFLKENQLPTDKKIIAWGESTSIELKKNGKENHFVLTTPTQEELMLRLDSRLQDKRF